MRSKKKTWLKGRLSFIVYVIILLLFVETLGPLYGITGYIIFTCVVTGIKIWMNWDAFMNGLRYIETMIHGKPLDPEYWKPGELKKRKSKLKLWRKNEAKQ